MVKFYPTHCSRRSFATRAGVCADNATEDADDTFKLAINSADIEPAEVSTKSASRPKVRHDPCRTTSFNARGPASWSLEFCFHTSEWHPLPARSPVEGCFAGVDARRVYLWP
ncbi:hypothetical protein PMG11_01398 [Penicillium brasilianum]|uniref:Uncharacterized protein n=1 Tax=Penicillium brasilianum TaxID=104259 RepID=A0A0F7TJC5_PENBI|nr:hypothetical protein PMG11_01398 [Penicillium brasilianum]